MMTRIICQDLWRHTYRLGRLLQSNYGMHFQKIQQITDKAIFTRLGFQVIEKVFENGRNVGGEPVSEGWSYNSFATMHKITTLRIGMQRAQGFERGHHLGRRLHQERAGDLQAFQNLFCFMSFRADCPACIAHQDQRWIGYRVPRPGDLLETVEHGGTVQLIEHL